MEIVAYRCVWDGEPGWMQYHDKTDPLPDQWDDDEHPDEVAALVLKIDADIEIERLRNLIDLAYDHISNCGYRDEDPTLTQLRAGLSADGLRREGFAPNVELRGGASAPSSD